MVEISVHLDGLDGGNCLVVILGMITACNSGAVGDTSVVGRGALYFIDFFWRASICHCTAPRFCKSIGHKS